MTTEPRSIGAGLANIAQSTVVSPIRPAEPEDWEVEQTKYLEGLRAQAAENRWRAAIPLRFQDSHLSDFSESVVKTIMEWKAVANSGANLVIFGPVGVGKTRAACAAVRRANERGLSIGFRPSGEMLDDLRPGGTNDGFTKLTHFDVLVIDDLGVEKVTDWTAERIDLLINRRWMDRSPTVMTTNLEPEALAEHVGERAYSRMVGDGAVPLKMTGEDQRRA